jgi:hypothetical protein
MAYEEHRREGRQNFEKGVQAAERGNYITELVLLKVLPHPTARQKRNPFLISDPPQRFLRSLVWLELGC